MSTDQDMPPTPSIYIIGPNNSTDFFTLARNFLRSLGTLKEDQGARKILNSTTDFNLQGYCINPPPSVMYTIDQESLMNKFEDFSKTKDLLTIRLSQKTIYVFPDD